MSAKNVVKLIQILKARKLGPGDFQTKTFFTTTDEWYYQAIDDDRTCDRCLMLDNGFYDGGDVMRLFPWLAILDEDTIIPNVHPNCRCNLHRTFQIPFIPLLPVPADEEKPKKKVKP